MWGRVPSRRIAIIESHFSECVYDCLKRGGGVRVFQSAKQRSARAAQTGDHVEFTDIHLVPGAQLLGCERYARKNFSIERCLQTLIPRSATRTQPSCECYAGKAGKNPELHVAGSGGVFGGSLQMIAGKQ